MTNDQCACGFFIKKLNDKLYKTENKIRNYSNK